MTTDPKKKLIESAVRVFADKGYSGAKVAEIVRGADANIAAVNYHFGSKERLFVYALRKAFASADETYPTRGDLDDGASAEKCLAAVARAILQRSLDEGEAGDFNRIMSRTTCVSGTPEGIILKEVQRLELNYISRKMAEFMDSDDTTDISLAVANFIALATLISRKPGGVKEFFSSAVPDSEVLGSFIEKQVLTIIATLTAFRTLTLQQTTAFTPF